MTEWDRFRASKPLRGEALRGYEAARAEMGISDGLLRLSVGLEHPADLIEDLARGFKAL